MRLTRIYTDQPLASQEEIELGPDAARHLVTVLRARPGDPVVLFNGLGGEYPGVIRAATRKSVVVLTGDAVTTDRESPFPIELGIGLSRGDRFDWVLQKATELGVTAITPLYTERTEVKLKDRREEKKQRHWQQVIISACEQCGRNRLPRLHAPRPLKDWLTVDADCRLVLYHQAEHSLREIAAEAVPKSAALLIGPEGGLAGNEIRAALDTGFRALVLGPRIMRTETAPVSAISVLQYLWGDLG